jgi:hypothetical protein
MVVLGNLDLESPSPAADETVHRPAPAIATQIGDLIEPRVYRAKALGELSRLPHSWSRMQ